MGRIKSAIEIALERTESVKSDKGSIDQFEARQQGKKLANEFLENSGKSLEAELKKIPKEQQESFRQGLFDVFISQIGLPLSKDDEKRIETVGRGLHVIIPDSRFSGLYKQFTQLLSRYLDELARYEEAIRRQYEPKLRQKEEELSKRFGRQVQLDPFQDPEFLSFYNQHMNALKSNYQTAADQVREETRRCFEGRKRQ
ncbi:MAG: hypothetical protein LBH26_06955 [Treponema sp.]|jgi:hypothetical protein|nr:hypothetical protein [Treponema sp.]